MNRYRWLIILVLIILVGLYVRPLPKVQPQSPLPAAPKVQSVDLPWPDGGQAAIGAKGYGLLAHHGSQQPAPIGSTAKIITAIALLQQKPIKTGTQGPTLSLSQADVDLYSRYYSQNGSSTAVSAGEQITELQALQSLMLPSSNNIADTLAVWAFGSKETYLNYANQMVKTLGLNQTTVADTNGFSDTTTSTADDLVRLGLAALNNPVLARVVNQTSANVPVAGTVRNTNILLGSNGIVGIKTGHTDKAGGNYVFAAKRTTEGRQVTIVGAILNQPSLNEAILDTPPLLKAVDFGFTQVTLARKGQTLGYYKAPWGAKAEYTADKDITVMAWKGAETKISARLNKLGPTKTGNSVGEISISNLEHSQKANLILSNDLSAPSPLWRIIH